MTMQRFGEKIALDYVENKTAYYMEGTLQQILKKTMETEGNNDEDGSNGYLISLLLCNQFLVQGFSDSNIYFTLAADPTFKRVLTKNFSGI